jgi:hypothetical protein
MAQVTYNEAEFRNELGLIAQISGRALADVILQQAALFTKDASGFTPPFGKAPSTESGGDKKKIGNKAVKRDIERAFSSVQNLRVYQPVGEGAPFNKAFTDSLRRAVRRKDTRLVSDLLGRASTKFAGRKVAESPSVELHNSMRNARGGVTKTRSIFILRAQSAINSFASRIQTHVGLGKAGWNEPLNKLAVKPPAWVQKQTRSVGIFKQEGGDTPSVTVGNAVPFVQSSASRIEANAWNNRMRNATKQREALERWQRKKLREAGIKTS